MLVKNVTDALILPHTGISMYTGQSFLPFFFVQHGQVSTLNIIIEYQDHLCSFAKIALLFFVYSVVSFVLLSLPCTFVIDFLLFAEGFTPLSSVVVDFFSSVTGVVVS